MLRTKQAFKDAKQAQFMADIKSCLEEGMGGLTTLQKLGYRISKAGKTTHFAKGRAIISLDGRNKAEVTLIVG